MIYLTLTTGLSYMWRNPSIGKIIHFQRNRVKGVEDDLADQLLATGRFAKVEPETFIDGPTVDMIVKFTGSIGDAIVTANCLAAVLQVSPNKSIHVQCDPRYARLVQCIAPGVIASGPIVHQMAKSFIDLAVNKRTPGEGFAWEAGIASALGLPVYPRPVNIKLLPKVAHTCVTFIKQKQTLPKLAGIHLWSNHSRSKSYDIGKSCDLIRQMRSAGFDCVLFGSRGDPKYSAPVIDIRGKSPLMGSFTLLDMMDVVVAVDSWVWHATKLLFKPQVVLFGSLRPQGTPREWENVELLRGTLCEGRDCDVYNCPVGKSNCIDTIEIADIMDAVDRVMVAEQSKELAVGV